jgi:outer membrane murein-binding lipoprotein Lpp
MKKFVLKTLFATALVAAVLAGCKKEKTEDIDTDTSAAEDNAFAENTSSDVNSIADQAVDGNSSLSSFRLEDASSVLSACATVTRDTINHIVTVTFDGTPCIDGRTRSGVLTFNYSASPAGSRHYRDPGFTCTVTSSNYVVDNNQVNIVNKTITNITHGGIPAGYDPMTENEKWTIVANISITRPNGAVLSWNCNRTKELLNTSTVCPASDFANFPLSDTIPINWPMARVGITGTASGTRTYNSVTESVSVSITSQLVRDFGACSDGNRHPFFMGELDHTRSGRPTRHMNFGSDAAGNISNNCDRYVLITFTVNGNPHSVVRQMY